MKKIKPKARKMTSLSRSELRDATAEYDQPGYPSHFDQPTAAQQARHDRVIDALRAATPRGRPRTGEGATRVLLSIEKSLLRQADAAAKAGKTTRSALVAQALRQWLRSPPAQKTG
ncbi:MAG TPA: ribbon-helix-helix domain-containing protein [Tepidisphaeraceae bacterium]|nr:ribbon-helix-helix domain-containing protein [Tepidisphaeraceae bacterium]